MIDQTHPYLAASWTVEDLIRLSDFRKLHAIEEQNLFLERKNLTSDKTLPKEVKLECFRLISDQIKFAQSFVKACTILLDYFHGKGKFETHSNRAMFAPELQLYFAICLNKL